MSDDEYGRVPAGWYPDPLGLPQLRWWDNHAWTEHVSDARQPVVPQAAATTTFADDELPERDEVDPSGTSGVVVEQPTAQVLRELEPPRTDPVPLLIEPDVMHAAAAAADVPPLHASVPTTPPPAAPAAVPTYTAPPAAPAAAPQREPAAGPASTPSAHDIPAWQQPAAAPQPAASNDHEQPAGSVPDPVPAASAPAAYSAGYPSAAQPSAPHPSAAHPSAPVGGAPFGANPDYGGWTTDAAGSAPHSAAPGTSAPFGSAPSYGAPGYAPQQAASQGYAPQPGYGQQPGYAPQYGSPAGYGSAAGYGSTPGYGSAAGFGSAPGAPTYAPPVTETPVAATRRRGGGASMSAGTAPTAPALHTVSAWAIALLPMLQLLLSLLVVAAFTGGQSLPIIAILWLAPYPVVIVLAVIDARGLRRRGVDRPASWLWSLLGPPVYLVARAVRLSRFSGSGFGPVAVFLLLGGLQVGAVIAVPGLIIGAVPQLFAAEASNSIELNARSIGSSLDVTCPDTPPLFIGQQFRCPAVSSDGTTVVVTASLQRSNGWIAWQVDDWGVYTLGG